MVQLVAAVLTDRASTWFDLNVPSPFMLSARPIGPDYVDKIAGVLHVDGTARVQTVDPATAPAYGVLIEHFHQFTGLPLVLNTSYTNREPLVQTPAHTLATVQACDLDAACIGPPRPATLNGMTTSTRPLREAARAVVLDADLRVLLLRYDENGGFWATPGGSLEEGEHPRAATRRELHEELGIDEKTVELGVQLAERSKDHLVGGREVRQIEGYFLAYVDPADVDPARATQPDNIREYRWWTRDQLRSTTEAVYPLGLADLVAAVAEGCTPEQPIVLT
ncbi:MULTISPECIES: carbamoyltransferase C-terminal domain-containing protein [Streptomyces]|nr:MULTISPECIES: carbamoyltransferase C-terminal domain-containing protein [Streptomyces]